MKVVEKLFSEQEIAKRIGELAQEIASAHSGDLTIVGILKGSFIFVADLARALDRVGITPRVDFIQLRSYGDAMESSGEVQLISEMPADIAGHDVLLVDDIADSGRTIAYAQMLLEDRGAAKVMTCVVADKPCRREVEFSADFVGFHIDDVFIVGYGTDYAEQYRHLPYIGALE